MLETMHAAATLTGTTTRGSVPIRRPAILPNEEPATGAFTSALAEVVSEIRQAKRDDAVLAKVLQMLVLYELLGMPLPASAIAELRAAGFEQFAAQMEDRNRRISEERADTSRARSR